MIGHQVYVPDGKYMQHTTLLEIGPDYVLVGESNEERAPATQYIYLHLERLQHIPQDCEKCKQARQMKEMLEHNDVPR